MSVEEFKLPDVGEGVAEGELVNWLVAPGDRVEEGEPVAEVETDKALVEVPSRYDGTVEELFAEEGDVVPVGDVIISFRVDEDGETFAPPSARRLARELGVDIAAVDGSGPGGRVSESDVRAHAEGDADDAPEPKPAPTPTDTGSGERKSAVSKRGAGGAESSSAQASAGGASVKPAGRDTTLATPATRKLARDLDVDLDEVPTDETRDGEAFVIDEAVQAYADALADETEATDASDSAGTIAPEPASTDVSAASASATSATESEDETVPYRGVRRTIGKQMERSVYTAPHVTHHDTAAVDALVEARERLKPTAEERGVSLTYMPFVMKAIVAGLKEHPYLNSELREDDEEIVLKGEYNLGIAVATDAGLMVPVVDDVDEKGLFELAAEVRDLASRARDRKLKPEEMKGGTVTITNFGAIGGEYATPIINHPETAILGLGAIEERPVVRESDAGESEIVPAPTLPLSLSIDHRVIDGAIAAEFANTVMEHLENPLLLLNH